MDGAYLEGRRFLSLSSAWKTSKADKDRLTLVFPEGLEELAVYCASGHEAGDITLDWARLQPRRSADYWASQDFPYDAVRVPDEAVQGILDSSIRNIYQAREIKNGLPVFQVGPTCYRGLWIVDGCVHPGSRDVSRPGPRGPGRRSNYILTRQRPDGCVRYPREVLEGERDRPLHPAIRHALLTGDMDWLEANLADGQRRLVGVIQPSPRGQPQGSGGARTPASCPRAFRTAGSAGPRRIHERLLEPGRPAGRGRGGPGSAKPPELEAWEAEYEDFWATFAEGRDATMRKTLSATAS